MAVRSLTRASPVVEFEVASDPKTARVVVEIPRPTTGGTVVWAANTTLAVSVVYEVDGQRRGCKSWVTGGVRVLRNGAEASRYRLVKGVELRYDESLGRWAWLGERAQTSFRALVRIELVRGNAWAGDVSVSSETADAPQAPRRNSVGFTGADSTREEVGDGVIEDSVTSSGTDRALYVGVGHSQGGGASNTTSGTYDGGAFDGELWDFGAQSHYRIAAYYKIAPATGATTVQITASAAVDEFALGWISMDGVHQTTAVGTPATGSGSTGVPTVTVSGGSPASDSLLVDTVYDDTGADRTAGADQTQRFEQLLINGFTNLHGSTQPGSASGGVMSWSTDGSPWLIGAVEFLASSGGAGLSIPVAMHSYRRRRV